MPGDPVKRTKWKTRVSAALTGVVAPASAGLSFNGLRAALDDTFTASLLVATSFLFQLGCWQFLYDAAPNSRSAERSPLNLVGFIGAIGIAVTSSWFAFLGLSADSSQRHHMQKVADRSAQVLGQLAERQSVERGLVPVISAASQEALRLSSEEAKAGMFTQRGSRGPISKGLQSLGESYANAASLLEEGAEERKHVEQEASDVVRRLRVLASRTSEIEPLKETTRQFSGQLLILNGLFSELEKSNLPTVESSIRKSDSVMELIPATIAKTEEAATRQKAAREAIESFANRSKEGILSEIRRLDPTPVSVPYFRMLSPHDASLTYVSELIQWLIYPLVLDLILPLLGMLILMWFSGAHVGSKPHQTDSPTTVGEDAVNAISSRKPQRFSTLLAAVEAARDRSAVTRPH